MADGAFPFLFHGPSPDDWFDEPVHAWLLRFERAVNTAERASLAPLWERVVRDHTRGLGADFGLPWVWNGEWALVHVRPGDRSRDTMRALFAAMQSMLRAVREVAPLAEVVYTQAADVSSDSAWEAWTVTQSPIATEAPPWPPEVVTHAKRSRKRSKAAPDPTFEAARAQARLGTAVAKVASVVEEEDDDEAPEEEVDEDEAGEPEGDDDAREDANDDASDEVALPEPRGVPLRLVKLDADEVEKLNEASDEPSTQKYDQSHQLPDGTWFAVPKRGKKNPRASLVLVVGGEPVATTLEGDQMYDLRAWCPDRREIFKVTLDARELFAIPLEGGSSRTVWTDIARDSMNEVFALRDGVLCITHARGVTVLAPKAPGDATAYHHAWDQNSTRRAPDRRGVVSTNSDEATVVRVTAFVDGALRIAGEVCMKTAGYAYLTQRGDDLYLTADDDEYRVEGIAEALDALFAAPTNRARFPALPEIVAPEVLADPTRNADVDDYYNRAAEAKDESDNAAGRALVSPRHRAESDARDGAPRARSRAPATGARGRGDAGARTRARGLRDGDGRPGRRRRARGAALLAHGRAEPIEAPRRGDRRAPRDDPRGAPEQLPPPAHRQRGGLRVAEGRRGVQGAHREGGEAEARREGREEGHREEGPREERGGR